MERKNVISRKNLPTKFPLFQSLLLYVMLDYYNAEGWLWGVFITVFSFFWLSSIIAFCKENDIDIFNRPPSTSTENKSKFQEKLDSYMSNQKNTNI